MTGARGPTTGQQAKPLSCHRARARPDCGFFYWLEGNETAGRTTSLTSIVERTTGNDRQDRDQAPPPRARSARLPQERRQRGGARRRRARRHAVCAVHRARGDAAAGKAGPQVRIHQAHRHGADRHRQGEWLLRGRRPLRQGRGAGELESAARPRHHRRARRRAHAGRPAARRHHRLRHQGARHHAVLHGPERQRHHRRQFDLGRDEAVHPQGAGRQAGAPDSRPRR